MASLTVSQTWTLAGTPTNATTVTYGLVRNDNGATIVPPGTALPRTATGIYSATLAAVPLGTTYTAAIVVTYDGQTYTFTVVCAPAVNVSAIQWPDGFPAILTQLMQLAAQITLNPNPNVSVHGHNYSNGQYLEILGRQIEQFTKLNAQAHPFEIVTGHGGK